MECFIVAPNDVDLAEGKLLLRGDEAHHALRALRLRTGEQLMATDLEGTCYRCELESSSDGNRKEQTASCIIIDIFPEYHESARSIILAQAILQQSSRFEEIIEKATELGITGFIPLITTRTEKRQVNEGRINRIIREATKQVSRARMPSFSEPMIFDAIMTHAIQKGRSVIVLHESAEQDDHLSKVLSGMSDMPITIFIGPEGGFTEDEIGKAKQHGAAIASLGPRRLRAETAAIAAVSLTCLQR